MYHEKIFQEALLRYPPGTKFKVVHDKSIQCIVSDDRRVPQWKVVARKGKVHINLAVERRDSSRAECATVWVDGKWAEVVSYSNAKYSQKFKDKLVELAKSRYSIGTEVTALNDAYFKDITTVRENTHFFSSLDGPAIYVPSTTAGYNVQVFSGYKGWSTRGKIPTNPKITDTLTLTDAELLEKAYRDYKIGVKFKSIFSDEKKNQLREVQPFYESRGYVDFRVNNDDREYDYKRTIYTDGGLSTKNGGVSNPTLYVEGKGWCPIVGRAVKSLIQEEGVVVPVKIKSRKAKSK